MGPPRPEDRGRAGNALGVASLTCSLTGSVLLGLAADPWPVMNGLGGTLGPTAQNVFGELFNYLPAAGTALLMAGFTAGLADRRTWRGQVGLALPVTAGCLAAFFLCGVSGPLLLAAYLLFMAYALANISLAGLYRAGSRHIILWPLLRRGEEDPNGPPTSPATKTEGSARVSVDARPNTRLADGVRVSRRRRSGSRPEEQA